jgi:sugar phosphate isomerase/epimerase
MFKNLNPPALGIAGHQSEIIELALNYGFAGLDISIVEFAASVKLKGLAYAKRLLASAKLRIGSFPLPLALDADDAQFQKDLQQLPALAYYAAELGCTRATTIVAPAGDLRPYHENFEFHRQRFHDICSTLTASGISLAVGFQAAEYHRRNRAFQFIHDLDSLAMLLNMVGVANIGLLLDTWEVLACGGSVESVRKLPAQQIVAVDVAEMPANIASADLDEQCRWLPGAENSRTDVAAFLAALKDIGYNGPVTVKPSRHVFANRRRDVIVKQTAESLDKVWLNGST